MFAKAWSLSAPEYEVHVDRDVRIPMSDGVELDADVFRPAGAGPCPAIVGLHGYSKTKQVTPSMPKLMAPGNGEVEAGDPLFWACRGYAHVIVNARGTGASGGLFDYQGPTEVRDGAETVAWVAEQEWCNGGVALAGQSYFAIMALRVAAARPPALRTIYAPWGRAGSYHGYYLGGILMSRFLGHWPHTLDNLRYESVGRRYLGDEEFEARLAAAQRDPELRAQPHLAAALADREGSPAKALIVDILLHRRADDLFWTDRDADVSAIDVPAVVGACWGNYGLHLSGALRAFDALSTPKKLIVGPPIYLDRPIYQLAYDQLRWFDHWLKGIDTGVMDEPSVRVFVPGSGRWLEREEWPLPETRWTPFNLHPGGLLSEHEFFPGPASTSFEHSYNRHGSLTFTTPKLVEETTLVGPGVLDLYASTTDAEALWFASLWDLPPEGEPELLTRGWLRGTLRAVDGRRSRPWEAWHPLSEPEPVPAGQVVRYTINLVATARRFAPGHRIALKIACSDPEPPAGVGGVLGSGRLNRPGPAWLTVHHDAEHPSCIHLPIVDGNVLGTFMSGGEPEPDRDR